MDEQVEDYAKELCWAAADDAAKNHYLTLARNLIDVKP